MFGAQYFGQEDFGGVPEVIIIRPPSGGGWSHRGPVTLPPRRNTSLLPKLPKPPYLWYTQDTDAD